MNLGGQSGPVESKSRWPGGQIRWPRANGPVLTTCLQEPEEAYRPPCIEYSFCCPNWVPPPILSWPRGGYPARGVPYLDPPRPGSRVYPAVGYPMWVPHGRVPPSWLARGVPYLGTPSRVPPRPDLAGCPPPAGPGWVPPRCLPHGILGNVAKHYGIWVPPYLDLAGYPPPPPPGVCPMTFWVMLQSIMGYGVPPSPPGVDKLTK